MSDTYTKFGQCCMVCLGVKTQLVLSTAYLELLVSIAAAENEV